MEKIAIRTGRRQEFVDITADVRKAAAKLKVKDGVITVFTPHTTAAVTINENADPSVVRDMLSGLDRMVPEDGHDHSEGNSPAHIKSSMIGCSEQALVSGGKLILGTWQGIYFCEFDGPRTRQVYIK
jgi:secondary thiamine-phosphate synthase enzyme